MIGDPFGRLEWRRLAKFRRDRTGSVAVEFALISSVLMAIFAGMIDLSFMVGAKRDAERASTLMTRALSSCPASNAQATWTGTDCVRDTMQQMLDRMRNILVAYPTATVGMASFQRSGSTILMCPGNMTYLEADMQTTALSILKDGDAGTLAYIKMNYNPFITQSLMTFATAANTAFRQYTVDVRGNGDPYRCAKN